MSVGTARELIAIIEPDGGYALDWRPGYDGMDEAASRHQQSLYEAYLKDSEAALLCLGALKKEEPYSESVEYLRAVAAAFVECLAKNPDLENLGEKARALLEDEESERLLARAPYIGGAEHLDSHWLECVWDRLNSAFATELKKHQGSAAGYLLGKNPDIHLAGKVYFHLVESGKQEYPFAFLATYAAEPSATGKARHLPLKNALIQYGQNSKKLLELLSTVNKAAKRSSFVAGLVETGEIFHPIGLAAEEAYTFLKEVPLYEEAGILCRIPNWWRNKTAAVKISVKVGTRVPSMMGLNSLLDFDVSLSLGGESLTVAELKRLISETDGLAFIKGKWVEVDRRRLLETLAAYEQARVLSQREDMTIAEAMRMQLSPSKSLDMEGTACEIEIGNGEWLENTIAQLKRPETLARVSGGTHLHAVLRDYQQKGLDWLYTMRTLGLGACLADDMGLGKTVQVIALLNSIRAKKKERVLIVVPASLISNWEAEISRFAPRLTFRVFHSQEKDKIADSEAENGVVYITTYGMLTRNDWFNGIEWDMLILDEAQAIKNPGTKQTKAAKRLRARCRIAMTGTPVENRLSDLWSIFDFLNKGLLGSAKEFTEFTSGLQENAGQYQRLKQVVSPFILRRLKTDKNIIADLPEKIEMKTYAALTKKQAALYSAVVNELQTKLESVDGIERRGLVLAALMKFKQICNHPDQYLGQNAYAENESGKYRRLREICETIYEKRERVLVFTQFKEITNPLASFLEKVFQHEGLILHGGTPVTKRKEIVARFQGHEYVPFMVLSIKAGGVGLNLTAANHVIHFDRWWNPAVENQATDRAFRIGQKRNVVVHKIITQGTLEEKIDLMIEEKSKLAEEIVSNVNEGWITEMDNAQLMNLLRLT